MNLVRNVRSAIFVDYQPLANLIARAGHVHRHLDWRNVLDWIGVPPFLVLEENGELRAALACPPDPPQVAWLRLYVNNGLLSDREVWPLLWETACSQLPDSPGMVAAAILQRDWLVPYLEANGFITHQQIVMLACEYPQIDSMPVPHSFTVRRMFPYDLPAVAEVDSRAFDFLWRNSLSSLELAYRQAAIATVAEAEQQLIGYQISTRTSIGIHLARLAVVPEAQGRGVGYALVADMMKQAIQRGLQRFTVNTQNDNVGSLSLYKRFGFRETGESYPVYRCCFS